MKTTLHLVLCCYYLPYHIKCIELHFSMLSEYLKAFPYISNLSKNIYLYLIDSPLQHSWIELFDYKLFGRFHYTDIDNDSVSEQA